MHVNVRDAILNTLKDLEEEDFREFCYKLTDPEETPCIEASKVEKKNRGQIMKLLVSRCEEGGAVVRAVKALRGIGCNNEARLLESKCKSETKAEENSCGERKPGPAPKPLSDQANKEPKGPQKAKKVAPKTKNTQKAGKTLLLFGKYTGKSFEWLLQNDLQYAGYLVGSHLNDRESGNTTQNVLMNNKDALAEYVSGFPDAVEAVHFYREGLAPVGFGKYKDETRQDLYNSADYTKMNYVMWLRSMEELPKLAETVAMIKYILYRDKPAFASTCFKTGPQRRSPRRRTPPELSCQTAAKKQRL